MERIELSFASMQALSEERLPPRQQAPLVQPKPQVGAQLGQGGGMQNVGEKTPIVEQVEPIPIDTEARNTIPRRQQLMRYFLTSINQGSQGQWVNHLSLGKVGQSVIHFMTR